MARRTCESIGARPAGGVLEALVELSEAAAAYEVEGAADTASSGDGSEADIAPADASPPAARDPAAADGVTVPTRKLAGETSRDWARRYRAEVGPR